MRAKIIIGVTLLVALLGLALTCESSQKGSAPSEPNDLHPNEAGPDEQGESGSLIEAPD